MRNIAELYSPKVDFWDVCPAFKDVDPFASLYSKDKSPGKRISSTKMWAIVLIYHPESDFYNLPQKEDKVKTAMDRNHRLKLDLSELEALSSDFYSMTLEQADESLIEWERRMKERDDFLRGVSWSLDHYNDEGRLIKGTADQLDKMHSQTAKHFKEFGIITKEVQELRLKQDSAKKKSNTHDLEV